MALSVRVKLWEAREGDKNRKGFIVLNDLVRFDITLFEKNGQHWIGYPSYKKNDGTWQETAGPVSREAREQILASVLKELNNANAVNVQPVPVKAKQKDVTEVNSVSALPEASHAEMQPGLW